MKEKSLPLQTLVIGDTRNLKSQEKMTSWTGRLQGKRMRRRCQIGKILCAS